jgi:hypothetical protein
MLPFLHLAFRSMAQYPERKDVSIVAFSGSKVNVGMEFSFGRSLLLPDSSAALR